MIYAAGGAIGGAVARAFAREGASVFLSGRSIAKVDAVAEEVVAGGGIAETAQVDALDATAVEEHLDSVVEKAGSVDISFNAIGPGPNPERRHLTELAADAFSRPIAFYASSNFITATAAARQMSVQGSGVIVTLTAVPGRTPAKMIGGAGPAWPPSRRSRAPWPSRRDRPHPGGLPALTRDTGDAAHQGQQRDGGPGRGCTPAQFQERLEQSTLLGRLPTLAEVADTAAFVASERAGTMTATVVNLSAGSIAD